MTIQNDSRVCAPEVLAPAGDLSRLRAALRYGADAVYLGGKEFTMRSAPQNFTFPELKTACDLAHRAGARVYFTCNILLKNSEVPALPDFLRRAAQCGVDAFIVADVGVLMLCRRILPQVEVHISTQAGVTNYLTARELYSLGAKRVVLARELSLDEIIEIRRNTPPQLEIECFVHGAMCVSISGRCLLSQYLAGRDANRGECAQPCRWKYRLVEEKRPGQFYPIEEGEKGTYLLNAKDLCLLPYVNLLCKAGINSLKIEGRAKSEYYVSVAANAYRRAVDLWKADPENWSPPAWLLEEPDKMSHREYCAGFLFGPPPQGQSSESGGYVRRWEASAVAESYRDGRLFCTQRNKFRVGDVLEALPPMGEPEQVPVTELFDGEGEPIDAAPHPMMPFSVPFPHPLPQGTILRRRCEQAPVP